MRTELLLLLAPLVVACGGANMTTYTPVHEETKYSEDSFFAAARTGAERLGYVTRASDSATHALDTREKQVAVSSVPRLSYKYSFHIETGGGTLSIEATCLENSATNENSFKDCGDDRPDRVVKELAALKKEILEAAPSASRDKTDWGALDDSKAGSAAKDDDEADAKGKDEKAQKSKDEKAQKAKDEKAQKGKDEKKTASAAPEKQKKKD
ncbi:MAG TPA: hypothetical protein VHE30_18055 [Polyangiaceae bacterium]|nr:hypothetical protein [Polyangiaceae bacterium]